MEEEELTEVRRRIRKEEANLKRTQELGIVDLELSTSDMLRILLIIEERLSTGMAILIGTMYSFEDGANYL
jgi:hypothetical protein